MEKCKKCGHEYMRDFKCSRSKMKHLTGRNCDDPKCGGKLRDTIINFGESLPDGKCFTTEFAKRHSTLCSPIL